MTSDPFELVRFIRAQEGAYAQALAEIRRGRKHGHWMWFVFPQMRGLGHSPMAQRFGITSLDEARAYLVHPILGRRLGESVEALQDLPAANPVAVFGDGDAMKLRSSLTLFALAGGGAVFEAAIARWFGSPDERTKALAGR